MSRILLLLLFRRYYFYFIEASTEIKIAVTLTFLFTLMALFSLFHLFGTQRLQSKNLIRNKSLEKEYGDILQEIAFSKENISQELLSQKFDLSKFIKETHKKFVINLLRELPFEKRNEQNINQLVRFFGIADFLEDKISTGRVKAKKEAMNSVLNLKVVISETVISSFLYHKDVGLRKSARLVFTLISQHNPFRFLSEGFDDSFTEWDKAQLHQVLQYRAQENPPNFTQFISLTDNEDLISFFIYEIGFFKQEENIEFLIGLYKKTKSQKIKKSIIQSLAIVKEGKYLDFLSSNSYELESIEIKTCYIKSLLEAKPSFALHFLEESFLKAYDVDLKILIGKAILEYKEEGETILNRLELQSSQTERVKLIFEHIKNPLIAA